METFRRIRRRAYLFLFGNYPGAPVDYILAIAAIYAAMVVTVVADWV